SGVAGAAVAAPPSMAIAATVGSLLSCQKSRPPAATRSTAATASQGAPLDTRGTSSSRSSSPNFGTAGDARTVPAAALTGTLAGAGPSRSLTASRGAPIPGSTMTAGMRSGGGAARGDSGRVVGASLRLAGADGARAGGSVGEPERRADRSTTGADGGGVVSLVRSLVRRAPAPINVAAGLDSAGSTGLDGGSVSPVRRARASSDATLVASSNASSGNASRSAENGAGRGSGVGSGLNWPIPMRVRFGSVPPSWRLSRRSPETTRVGTSPNGSGSADSLALWARIL